MDDNQTLALKEHDKSTCPYCAKLEGAEQASSLENCQYCAKTNMPDPTDECPYCAAMEADGGCKYCSAMDPAQPDPAAAISQNYASQDLEDPAMPKPVPGSEPAMGLGVDQDTETVNNQLLDQNPQGATNEKIPQESVQLDQSKEAMQAIAQQIENDGAQAQAPIAPAPVAAPMHMEGNVSRPENFDENTPGDMGLAEGEPLPEPDLTEVLHEGLDSHADNIQRERVVQMVSQALEGFKASKQIIERAQEQAPQLYQSSIAMLRAMIEMCKMLGLGAEGAPVNEEPMGEPELGEPTSNEWAEPFPTHPDQGGEAQPGHAPSANPASAEGAIGQPIGKLPTSATTPHVARTPQLPGAVNTKGQKKVIDPETGETRWIDMKEGRVQSPEGIPVKPPRQGQNGSQV